mgnify:CR=1 FL=1|tara:strand:- start:338 stop:883 length:546 start_codon:yes stop_codon:yes gene_type:complete
MSDLKNISKMTDVKKIQIKDNSEDNSEENIVKDLETDFQLKKNINSKKNFEIKKIKITKKQKITQDLLKKMLLFFNINFVNIKDLINIELERNSFLTPEVVEHFQKFKNEFKNLGYKTGKLTSLHKNNLVKQKFPAINMLRQLLKCNNLLLKPLIKSNGYDKITGRKNTIRYFIIKEKESV